MRRSDLPAMNDNAVYLIHRGVPIAGKPRSHKGAELVVTLLLSL